MLNPVDIFPRYEIRKLGPEHLAWGKAIVIHSMVFHSPVWPKIYPEHQIQRVYQGFQAADYIVRHQIDSGLSYGVFDKEYQFKHPESAKSGGALYWDEHNLDSTSELLLEQMDFPLVSIALAFDTTNPFHVPSLKPFCAVLPFFPVVFGRFAVADSREPGSWEAKGPKEVMGRSGTATRADYEGQGIMKKMSHWLMREAANMGFRGITIDCFHDAVHCVWMTPPAPFKATLAGSFNINDIEEEVDGKMVKSYPHVDQVASKVYVALY
jgi:hypothetical protein